MQVFHENKFHSEEVAEMLKTCEDIERIMQKVYLQNFLKILALGQT